MGRDEQRLQGVQHGLLEANLDAVACRLPENVLLLSGYWPMSGMSWAIVARDQEPVVIAPVGEEEWVERGWPGATLFYNWGGVSDPHPDQEMARLLAEVSRHLGLEGKRIGYEGSFEIVAPPFFAAEHHVPAGPTSAALHHMWGNSLVDATDAIHRWRAIKTKHEQETLRLANEVAALGLKAFVEAAVPGAREVEVSAAIEAAIYSEGTGYKGVRRCRAWAEVMSGPEEGAVSWYQFLISSDRRLEEGDTALLELGTIVEGFWSDLTRTVIVGRADDRKREAYNAVLKAQQAGIDALRPGVTGAQVHAAARGSLEATGWADMFPHGTGHGLGFRYHEPIPLFLPSYNGKLEPGMVVTVEPGVYGRGFGGIRIEDDVLVTEEGPVLLSEFTRELIVTGS
jgi:Xaa-Pro dipeptidase